MLLMAADFSDTAVACNSQPGGSWHLAEFLLRRRVTAAPHPHALCSASSSVTWEGTYPSPTPYLLEGCLQGPWVTSELPQFLKAMGTDVQSYTWHSLPSIPGLVGGKSQVLWVTREKTTFPSSLEFLKWEGDFKADLSHLNLWCGFAHDKSPCQWTILVFQAVCVSVRIVPASQMTKLKPGVEGRVMTSQTQVTSHDWLITEHLA